MKGLHVLLLLLINVIWGLNVIAMKESVTWIEPFLSVALRYSLVLVACLPFLRIIPGRMRLMLLTGLIAGAVQFGFGAWSFHVANNVSALAIAGQIGVPLSLVLAVLIDGERIAWRRTLGIVLAMGGVSLLVFDPRIAEEREAILLTLAANVCWAVSALFFRRLGGIHVLTVYGWQALVSIPLLLLTSIAVNPGGIPNLPAVPVHIWGWVLFSALLSSVVGHAGMTWLLQRYQVSQITPYMLLTPVLSVFSAGMWYADKFTPLMIVGGLMTLGGVSIISLRSARKIKDSQSEKPS